MKIVQINATCGRGSTGKICVSISKLLTEQKIENYILYCSGDSDYSLGIKCAEANYIKWQSLKTRIWGNWGFNSQRATKKIIAHLERIQPDVVYLHNMHSHNCNIEMLFQYLKEKKIKVFWTFHDCWPFTGYCMHFTMVKCDGWTHGCGNCPLKHESSWMFDRSKEMLNRKRKMVEGVDLTIITPSFWLADLVKQSFYACFPIKVIHNGIDLSVFQPTQNDFKAKYDIENKFVVLGVAFGWDKKKGLDVFVHLAKKLDESFQIVLVGTDDAVDRQLPSNIISIHRTQNQQELAEIYTAADVFVNTTREEVLGLVNIEALACGTPVITFKTGGSPECIDETCGMVVDCDDVDALERAVIRICHNKPYSKESCMKKTLEFDENKKYKEYLNLI